LLPLAKPIGFSSVSIVAKNCSFRVPGGGGERFVRRKLTVGVSKVEGHEKI